jgi:hypothetical protein
MCILIFDRIIYTRKQATFVSYLGRFDGLENQT